MNTAPARPGTADPVRLGRNADFVRLWLSQTLSATGSRVSYLVYPLLVLTITGSASAASVVAAVAAFAGVVVRIPAGVLLDRANRRTVMLSSEAVRVVAMATAVVAVALNRAPLSLIAVVAAIDASGSALFVSAERTILRHIVPLQQVPAATARNEARTFTAELLGPALGGALYGLARTAPFVFNIVAYGVSFVAVLAIRKPLRAEAHHDQEGWGTAFASGVRFLAKEPFLRALATVGPLLNMAFTGIMFVVVVVLHNAGVPPQGIGVSMATVAVGGIAGAVIAPWMQRALRPRRLVVGLSWLSAFMAALCVLLPAGYWVVAPLPVLVLLAPATTATLFGHQNAVTPDHLQGRVVSTLGLLVTAMNPVAPLLAGILLARWDSSVAFGAFAGIFVIASIIVTLSRGMRSFETPAATHRNVAAEKVGRGVAAETANPSVGME
ncbi:MFS transporter [Dactylosporangium sp. CA-139114]|uniref:MFS transporter n=1 Tax=Dactylosporangium sp. CA-139114 TaxID=3239931 RepID=UPI003D99B70D